MPPKQVYGKRSRAIYDPFQAFVSPQRPAPKSNIRDQGVFVAEVVEELSRLKVGDCKNQDSTKNGRKALEEKSVNETTEPVRVIVDGSKTKRRRKKVDEDVESTEKTLHKAPGRARWKKSLSKTPKQEEERTTPPVEGFVADNVPMFVDGHGYEMEQEEPTAQVKTPRPRPKEISQESDTPSISILPPTPPPEDDEYTTHCSPLLGLSSHGITSFTEWSNQLTNHFAITKIAEASFGEVYRLSLLEDLSSFSHSDESVLKIIALKPPETSLPLTSKKKERAAALKKAEAMSKVEDVANEVKLLQRMSTIPGFTNFRDVRIMKGRPPQPFIKAFKDFNLEQKARKKEPSVFPDPAKKASYADDQLWAVIEMQDAGMDLERCAENGQCQDVWSVWDIFWQVALTLGKGEEGAQFEHRDLHLGNVCVRRPSRTESEKDADLDTKRKLNFTSLETTIIDYTISRALLTSSCTTSIKPESENIAYHDLSTPQATSIFEGDSTEEYQYDIYRYMRGCVLAGDPYDTPSPHNNPHPPNPQFATTLPCYTPNASAWSAYHPRTNLIWLHFLLHSLLEQLDWPSASKAPARKKNGGKDHAIWKRANDLEHVLLRVQELLDPGVVCAEDGSGLASAGALVGLALEEGWLDVGDVVGGDGVSETDVAEEGELVEGLVRQDVKAVGEGDTLGEVQDTKAGSEQKADEPARTVRTRRKK